MRCIGITGGIGSGKSVLSSLLEIWGVPVYIADTESKRLTNTSPLIRAQLTSLLGPDIYRDGQIDRTRLAASIFSSPTLLAQVDAIIHPEVFRHFSAWVAAQSVPLCGIESAILFESGFYRSVDAVVMVYAPLSLRIARAAARDGVDDENIRRRIRNQMDEEEKKRQSHYIIYNDGRQALIPQLLALLDQLTDTAR